MAIALLVHSGFNGNATGGTTSPGIDTSTATLLIGPTAQYQAAGLSSVSDSKSNSPWNSLTRHDSIASSVSAIIFYANGSLTVGSSHTLTENTTNNFPAFGFAAFSGVKATGAFDQQNGNNNAGGQTASLTTGSVTPSTGGQLIIAILATYLNTSTVSVDSGFTIIEHFPFVSGQSFGFVLAYKIKAAGDTTAENPTFSWTGNDWAATAIATFQPGASTETATGTMTFAGIAMSGVGNDHTGTGRMTFAGISMSGVGKDSHTGAGRMTFPGISFSGAGTAGVFGTAHMAFAGVTITANGLKPGAPGTGLRQFWTF